MTIYVSIRTDIDNTKPYLCHEFDADSRALELFAAKSANNSVSVGFEAAHLDAFLDADTIISFSVIRVRNPHVLSLLLCEWHGCRLTQFCRE